MKLPVNKFLKDQFRKQAPVVKADLSGKTVVVLGANAGIGFEATKHFATMNPGRLILACRSESRGKAALDKLKAETRYTKAELWIIDLADFESVKRFADKFDRDGGRLDILVANAALNKIKYEETKDGWESSIQVNDISTPLVSLLLLPRMIRTAQEHGVVPRLVVVGSEVHYWTDIPADLVERGNILATLGSKEACSDKDMRFRYMVTKLLTILFVRALNAHLPLTTPLIITSVNPGLCVSSLNRDLPGPAALFYGLFEKGVGFTAEEGSRRLVHGAVGTNPHPGEMRGQYLNACRVQEPSDWVIGEVGRRAQERCWDELIEILGKVDPRVLSIVEEYLTAPVHG